MLWKKLKNLKDQIHIFESKEGPHRPLREIDFSLAIDGGLAAAWAMALNPGENQYTGPAFSTKACFMVAGNITTSVNKGRQAGPMEQSTYLDVYEGPWSEVNLGIYFLEAKFQSMPYAINRIIL